MKGWIYILECSDKSYYVGSTNNLERRIKEHQSGQGSLYTSKRLPIKLLFSFECENIVVAFNLEHQIKKWSRSKKEALIRGEYNLLVELSKKKFRKSIKDSFI
ncbi:MAG: GIY-YIG nuclease family protein [Bacteroidota bacterium]|nr:GIY-YIG nuclease family protein [Bacteroidota bacterium]